MKPRTKIEKRVVELDKKFKPLSPWQKEWAKNAIPHIGYTCAGYVWCTACGASFPIKEGKTAVCPICGRKLELKKSQKRHAHEEYYFHVLDTAEDFQVVRTFLITLGCLKYERTSYRFLEVIRRYIPTDGKMDVVLARSTDGFSLYCDSWLWNSSLSLKKEYAGFYVNKQIKYSPPSRLVCPRYKVLPVIKRNGFTLRGERGYIGNLLRNLLYEQESEFLIKSRQYSLLHYFCSYRGGIKNIHHAICICNRNGYIVKDASMYIDYMDLLEYFNLDTHNAHYVCPKNLKKAHDKLLERKRKKEEEKRLREKAEQALKWEMEYHKAKAPFLGITFSNEDIKIDVIQSVKDMKAEGEAMHHCVFEGGYYKRSESLILSAKNVHDGKRIETIEVNLKNFEVVQSRGVCNKSTSYHDEIVSLVQGNMNQIIKAKANGQKL